MRQTYFVVQAFEVIEGHVTPSGKPYQPQSEGGARAAASRLAATYPAVLAFSRTGDAGRGDWDDAVILARYGDITDEALQAMEA